MSGRADWLVAVGARKPSSPAERAFKQFEWRNDAGLTRTHHKTPMIGLLRSTLVALSCAGAGKA